MFKKISTFFLLILSLFLPHGAWSAPPPEVAAVHIMTDALLALKESKAQGKSSVEDVEELIAGQLLPDLDINESTRQSLKKHWNDLSAKQKLILRTYVAVSLVDNYAAILAAYDDLDGIKISTDPQVRRKDNKAIVKLNIHINGNSDPFIVDLKMILNGDWRIYDVVFSGVSLVKNHKASFGSHVKRKGIESLIAKASKKLKKHVGEDCPVCIAMNLKKSVLLGY